MNSTPSLHRKKVYRTRDGEKVLLQVMISKEVYEMLAEIAPRLYGAYKGALSYVVEEALRLYLEPRHTQVHTNPSRRVRDVYEQVIQAVKEIMGVRLKPPEVPERILDQAIMMVRGSDPRTIAKWKNIFERMGLIKFVGGYKPNRIVELI